MTAGTERQIMDYVNRSGDVGELGGLAVFLFAQLLFPKPQCPSPSALFSNPYVFPWRALLFYSSAVLQTRPTLLRSAFPRGASLLHRVEARDSQGALG